jgi:hypothetical protein
MPVNGIVRSPVPADAHELLSEVRAMVDAGADQTAAIDYVYAIAARLGLRVRHDQHELHPAPEGAPETAAEGAAEEATEGAAEGAPEGAAEGAPEEAAEEATEGEAALEEADGKAAARRATGRGARRRARKRAPVVGAPTVRRADGTHVLDLGSILGLRPAPGAPAADEAAPARGRTVGRLVLSCDRRGGRARGLPDSALRHECNGLVVDARAWRPLAVPPGAFNPRANTRMVDAMLTDDLYDIIPVDDGTIVTLYCWAHPTAGPTWALASSGGYDVSGLQWFGRLTYAGVFHDLVTRLYPAAAHAAGMSFDAAASRLAFAQLDPACCYTVGFRHHAFHPLTADPERMWQIQCTDLAGDRPRAVHGGGIPHIPGQRVLRDHELARLLGSRMPTEGLREAGAVTCESLRALGRDALPRAIAAIGAHELAPLNYGFILRTRDPARTGEHGDVLLETPLLARVRKLAYERAPPNVRDHLAPAERFEYNAMRAFLTVGDRADFQALYPGWAPRLAAFGQFVDNVVARVIHALRQRAMAPASREPAARTPTGQVAAALLEHIRQFEDLATFNAHTEQIVHDYVVNPEYAFLFLRAIQLGSAPPQGSAAPGAAEPSKPGERNLAIQMGAERSAPEKGK